MTDTIGLKLVILFGSMTIVGIGFLVLWWQRKFHQNDGDFTGAMQFIGIAAIVIGTCLLIWGVGSACVEDYEMRYPEESKTSATE